MIDAQVADAPRTVPLAVPFTHLQTTLAPQSKFDRNSTLLLRLPESLRLILRLVRTDSYCRNKERLGRGFELKAVIADDVIDY
jgi:hypothetical protein